MKMTGHWVYLHWTPDGMVYVGMSGQNDTRRRWHPLRYVTTSLAPYIEKYGMDNIRHEVVKDGLTREEAFKLENELIRKYRDDGVCINRQNSGGLSCNGELIEYSREYTKTHREEIREYNKQYYQTNREKENKRCRQYKIEHREEIREYDRQYKREHREEVNARKRAYRAAKKQQKDKC